MALTITNDIHNNPYKIYAWRDNNLRFIASQYEGTNTTSIDEAIAGSSDTTITSAKTIWFKLYDERGELVNLSSYSSIDMFFRLPNGEAMYSCDIYTEDPVDYVRFVLRNGITQNTGEVYGELVLTTTTGTVKFYGINFLIKDATSDSAGSDAPLYGTMISALQRIAELENSSTGTVVMSSAPLTSNTSAEGNPVSGVDLHNYLLADLQAEQNTLLPATYQQVEYITNAAGTYIDLGITASDSMSLSLAGYTSGNSLLGALDANAAPVFELGKMGSNYGVRVSDSSMGVSTTGVAMGETIHHFVYKNKVFYVDNGTSVDLSSNISNSFNTNYNLFAFARNEGGTVNEACPADARIYGITIWSATQTDYYIPCFSVINMEAGLYRYTLSANGDISGSFLTPSAGSVSAGDITGIIRDNSISDDKLQSSYLSEDNIDTTSLSSLSGHVPWSSLVSSLLAEKADTSDLHSHDNLTTLDRIKGIDTTALTSSTTYIASSKLLKTLLSTKVESSDLPRIDTASLTNSNDYIPSSKLMTTLLAEKADTSDIPNISSTTVTLSSSNWSSSSQTVTVSGATSSNVIYTSPATSSIDDAARAQIYCTAQGADSLTFTYKGTAPTSNITMNVVIIG